MFRRCSSDCILFDSVDSTAMSEEEYIISVFYVLYLRQTSTHWGIHYENNKLSFVPPQRIWEA